MHKSIDSESVQFPKDGLSPTDPETGWSKNSDDDGYRP